MHSIICSFFVPKIYSRVTAGAIGRIAVIGIFGLKAFHRGPRFQQGAIHTEVLFGHQPFQTGLIPNGPEKQGTHLAVEQPVTVFGKG